MKIRPEKLVHSGKKRAYPSAFFWYCTCGEWHNYSTRRLFGVVKVNCTCGLEFELDKSNPKAEQTGGGFFTENKTTIKNP